MTKIKRKERSMITVSIKDFVDAIREADAFTLPEMNDGTAYLHDAVYKRMAKGHDVRLSELNFDAFEQEDVDSLRDLYSDIFEQNHYMADGISSTLQALAPVCKAVGYV
jgi:hypothetical protein